MKIVLQRFPGQLRCSELIGGSEGAGWYAFVEDSLLRWTRRESDGITSVPLQWDYPIAIGNAMHGLIGNTYIVGGMKTGSAPGGGGGPIRFGEFDAATGELRGTYENGSRESRWGAGTVTKAGGFVAVVYVDVLPRNDIVLDVFYRRPSVPPMPGTEPPPAWSYERRTIPTKQSGVFDFLQVVQGPDGLIYVFIARDSAGTVALLRYRAELDRLVLVDENAEFIPRGLGPISIMGEAPRITAVPNRYHGTVTLAYESSEHRTIACVGRELVSKWSVVDVKPDLTYSLMGETEWWAPHTNYPIPLIVPRSDGVYFALEHIEDDCKLGWHLGRLAGGVFEKRDWLPYGSILGLSQDGWAFFFDRRDQNNPVTYLLKVRCAPEMTIQDAGEDVLIDWTEADPTGRDVLQADSTPDFKNPTSIYGTGHPPRRIRKTGAQQFFRVMPYYQPY